MFFIPLKSHTTRLAIQRYKNCTKQLHSNYKNITKLLQASEMYEACFNTYHSERRKISRFTSMLLQASEMYEACFNTYHSERRKISRFTSMLLQASEMCEACFCGVDALKEVMLGKVSLLTGNSGQFFNLIFK